MAETGRSLTARHGVESTVRPGMTHDLPIFSTWWKRGPSTAAAASAARRVRWTKGRNRRAGWCSGCSVLAALTAPTARFPLEISGSVGDPWGACRTSPKSTTAAAAAVCGERRGEADDPGGWTQARGQARRGTNLRLGDHGSEVSFSWHRRLPRPVVETSPRAGASWAALNVGIEGPWLGSHGRQAGCRSRERESVCGCGFGCVVWAMPCVSCRVDGWSVWVWPCVWPRAPRVGGDVAVGWRLAACLRCGFDASTQGSRQGSPTRRIRERAGLSDPHVSDA